MSVSISVFTMYVYFKIVPIGITNMDHWYGATATWLLEQGYCDVVTCTGLLRRGYLYGATATWLLEQG